MIQLKSEHDILEFEKQGIRGFQTTSYESLVDAESKYGSLPALHFIEDGYDYKNVKSWTYSQFLQEVNAVANMFHKSGLKQNEAVAYMLPNLPETCFTFFGAQVCGIANPINPMLEKEHIADILNGTKAKILVTLSHDANSNAWEKINFLAENVPSLKTVFYVSTNAEPNEGAKAIVSKSTSVKFLDFASEKELQRKSGLDFEFKAKPDLTASYFHTGGTTGSPKIAPRSHFNEVSNTFTLKTMIGLESQKTVLCGLPWFHANGVLVTGMMPFYNGCTMLLASPLGYRDKGVMENFWEIVEYFSINYFSAVPAILKRLLSVPVKDTNISSLQAVICGAAPLSTKLFNDFQDTFGLKILEGYGFTEGTCVSTVNPYFGQRKVGSIGLRLPYQDLKVVILDEAGVYNRDAECNEIGLFVAKGTNVFKGYKEEKHNKFAWVNDGKENWYNTGDIGRKDEDGYFWITGRKKELIIRGGHNIDPKSIEEPLSKHPSIAAVAAVSRPDYKVGELPVAYVELKKGASTSVEALQIYAEENIKERAAVPKKIYILDSLPLTAVGKVFKPELVNRQIKEVFEEKLEDLKGIESANVSIENHISSGKLARVQIAFADGIDENEINDKAQEALAVYPIKFQIEKKS